jgi:hypothetical protein
MAMDTSHHAPCAAVIVLGCMTHTSPRVAAALADRRGGPAF